MCTILRRVHTVRNTPWCERYFKHPPRIRFPRRSSVDGGKEPLKRKPSFDQKFGHLLAFDLKGSEPEDRYFPILVKKFQRELFLTSSNNLDNNSTQK